MAIKNYIPQVSLLNEIIVDSFAGGEAADGCGGVGAVHMRPNTKGTRPGGLEAYLL